MTTRAPPAVPCFLRIPAVVALSLFGAGLGFAVIRFYPHAGADEAFLARLKWWKRTPRASRRPTALQKSMIPIH
jgi:hypothetical protein